jgi:hypothetical protein
VKTGDPGSAALATYLAMLGLHVSARRLSDLLVLVSVVSSELGAALGLLLVQSVGGGHNTPSVVEQITERQRRRPRQHKQNLVKTILVLTLRHPLSERQNARLSERSAMRSAGSATSFG